MKLLLKKNRSEKLSTIEAHLPIHKILNTFGNKFHNRGPSHFFCGQHDVKSPEGPRGYFNLCSWLPLLWTIIYGRLNHHYVSILFMGDLLTLKSLGCRTRFRTRTLARLTPGHLPGEQWVTCRRCTGNQMKPGLRPSETSVLFTSN